jgi:chemotaxis protein CheD
MRTVVVDIADYKVSNDPNTILITYSLGSCIGLTIYDPAARVGGLLHFMLPESTLSPEKAQANPAMFCDTGVPRLFHAAYELGAQKSRLQVKVAGGAMLLDENGTFNIGKRNYLALRKLLWKNGVLIDAEDVGGAISRTVSLNLGTGAVIVKSRNREKPL